MAAPLETVAVVPETVEAPLETVAVVPETVVVVAEWSRIYGTPCLREKWNWFHPIDLTMHRSIPKDISMYNRLA